MNAVDFEADRLVAEAVESAGCDDFGELPWREGLEALLATYDRHVRDPAGRRRCRSRVLGLIGTRLRCERALRELPAVGEQTIDAPLFVTGLPRSGTSALLNLLAAAPDSRALLQWEAQFPDPWPGSAPGDEDPRYPHLVKALAASRGAFDRIHYSDADTPEECILLHAYALHGVQLGFEIMLEPYRSWLLSQDLEPLYRFQKRLMQLLSWRRPGGRWVLKAPAHLWALETILEVFPDARFVWCHRDPQAAVPSMNSMNSALLDMYAGDWSHLDRATIGRRLMEWYALSLERGLAARERLPEERFDDCSHAECVREPLALAERLLDAAGMAPDASALVALRAHAQAHPPGRHGRHTYRAGDHGLDREMIGRRFAFYTEDPRWPPGD